MSEGQVVRGPQARLNAVGRGGQLGRARWGRGRRDSMWCYSLTRATA